MSDLISKKTRIEFREYFVGTSLRHISQEFDAVDVPCDADFQPRESGQRRSLVEQYYHAVDFSSWRDVRKVLRVYEAVLVALEEQIRNQWDGTKDYSERTFSVLKRCLERDGFQYKDGRISPLGHNPTIDELAEAAQGFDAHVLHQQIDWIHSAIEDDPDLAIEHSRAAISSR
jgi:virulence-associated protein VapD